MEKVVSMLGVISVIRSAQVGAMRSPLTFAHSPQNGIRTWGTRSAFAPRPVATSLVAQEKRRRRVIMDAGDNLDQLEEVSREHSNAPYHEFVAFKATCLTFCLE